MSGKEEQGCPDADPSFDGRLVRPLSAMTVEERLEWIWEMMLFRHWARQEVRGAAVDRDRQSPPAG